jgi:hypothetical protein
VGRRLAGFRRTGVLVPLNVFAGVMPRMAVIVARALIPVPAMRLVMPRTA